MAEYNTFKTEDGKIGLDLTREESTPQEKAEAMEKFEEEQKTKRKGLLRKITGGMKDLLFGHQKYYTKEKVDKKVATYWEDYYSGCDVGVVMGDIWVDDIITIQYTLTNNKSPIYGYMSENFDAVAKGTRIVQGQFAIAFKEVGYLNKILEAYEHRVIDPTRWMKTKSGLTGISKELFQSISTEEVQSLKIFSQTPEYSRITEKDFNEEELKVLKGGVKSPDKFGYKDLYSGEGVNRVKIGSKILREGFDLIISFGDTTESYRGGTVEIINNCHITSRSIVCEPTGEPIAEVYTFFARGLNEYMPKYKFDTGQYDQPIGPAEPPYAPFTKYPDEPAPLTKEYIVTQYQWNTIFQYDVNNIWLRETKHYVDEGKVFTGDTFVVFKTTSDLSVHKIQEYHEVNDINWQKEQQEDTAMFA